MTMPFQTIGYLSLNNTGTSTTDEFYHQAAIWFNGTQLNMQQPFHVWTETPNPNQSGSFTDMGCYNFITGAGGFIQSIVAGYGGWRIRPYGLHVRP